MEGTVRTLSKDGPAFVREHMDAILKGLTSAYGATYTLDYKEGRAVTWNDPALTAASRPALESIVGKAQVVTPPPQMGAEDFSYYQARTPGLFFFLGVANPKKNITAMIHTEYFDLDEDALPDRRPGDEHRRARCVVQELTQGTECREFTGYTGSSSRLQSRSDQSVVKTRCNPSRTLDRH